METKFNSQICTTREQSERLLMLGLKKETADMLLSEFDDGSWRPVTFFIEEPDDSDASLYPEFETIDIPAWSLHRLWELTPKVIFTKPSLYLTMCEDSVFYCAEGNNEEYEKSFSRQISLYDNIIDCIESLIKEGNFNKEYLV